ncbi:MAG: TIGR04283 family arsenosugar biosynthesis glycosyltransferase [Pseudomonadota bacterium]
MSAPLSVIIPTLNAADRMADTLAPLVSGASEGLVRELVVSDGGSSDDIAEIAEGVGAQFVSGAASRGGQLRRGAEVARGDWLLFLHADTVLPPGWREAVQRHIESDARAAVFRLRFDHGGMPATWVAGWANWRTRLFALPYGDQALLISRRHYDRVGGFGDLPIMEDVDLARRIGRRHLVLLPETVTTSAEKYQRDGWMRRGAKNWRCLLMYAAGVPPERIVEKYR